MISLRGAVWTHKTSLTRPHMIEMAVQSQERDRPRNCLLRVSHLPLSTILIFDFGIVPLVWYSLVFILFIHCDMISNLFWTIPDFVDASLRDTLSEN